MLFEEHAAIGRERWFPSAQICAVLANIHRDSELRSEPFTLADFVPGFAGEDEEVVPGLSPDMKEFIDRVQAGDTFELPPEKLEQFRTRMESSFRNVKTAPREAPNG